MRFLLLGPVEAWAGDHEVPLRPRQRAVLAYLLLARGRMVGLDRIEQALWGGTPPATARAQIQADISSLRRALGESTRPFIATRPSGYELKLHNVALDVDEFTERIAAADKAVAAREWPDAGTLLRSALELWRGPALAGLDAAFAEPARAPLEEQRLNAVERLAEVELCLGRHHSVVADLTEHVHAHPYREHLRGLMMLALYRSGRRADALASARDLRRELADQQGLDPGGEISRLETMILRDNPELHTMFGSWAADSAGPNAGPSQPAAASDPTDARPVRTNQLPPATSDFTGHADQCTRARDLVTNRDPAPSTGASVLVAISGMGGVGKTALAVKVAHEMITQFPDGCLFRDLQAAMPQPADTHAVLGSFLRALGVAGSAVAADPDERLGQYRSITAQRRVLVVLDDAATEGQVRPLLPTGAGCAAVVTSRRPLAGLDGATLIRLAPLDEADSVRLLGAILGPERVAADPATAARVAALCGGLPLALRIAGARVAASDDLTLVRLEELLTDEHGRLNELTAGDRDIHACFRVGYQRLNPPQSSLFRAVGLHPVSRFSARDAATLAGRSAATIAADLHELVDAQLVGAQTPAADDRFWIHDLVRQYARDLGEITDARSERDSAIRRLLDSYIDTAHAAGVLLTAGRYEGRTEAPRNVADPLRFTDSSEAVDWYEDSQRALVAAVHLASSLGWHAETWRLTYTLRTFLRIRHHTDDWMALNDLAMAAACSLGDPAAQLRMHESICGASLQALRLTDCVGSATRMVELAEVVGDRACMARGHHLLGIAYDRLRQRDLAEQHLNLALAEQAYASGPDAILGYLSIGAIYGAQGRYDECRTALHNARDLAGAINDESALCVAHHNLAELCLLTGDAQTGADHAREEISIARRIRFPMREARGNEILADCLMRTDPTSASEAWRRAIDIYDRIDPKLGATARHRLDELAAASA